MTRHPPPSPLFPYTTLFRSSISHFVLLALLAQAQAPETPAQRDARMAWWRDAQFGMFIHWGAYAELRIAPPRHAGDRKSTRLNSSHLGISYAVFCLKKKK